MPKKRKWEIGGQIVTTGDIRRYMVAVVPNVAERYWSEYVRGWGVVARIAKYKSLGTFEAFLQQEALRRGVKLRKARSPNRIHRLRQCWPQAANDPRAPALGQDSKAL
jgi:hypothetical protein